MTTLALHGNRMLSHDAPYSFELQAYYDKKKRIYSFPICGDILRRLDDLDIMPDLMDRLQDISAHQKLLDMAKKNTDFPNDRLFIEQRSGANWLRAIKKGILSDDQGTGKTVTSLAAAKEIAPARGLIICSKIKRQEWAEHVEDWTGQPAEIYDGQTDWTGYLVIHYDAIMKNRKLREKIDLMIMDEAHIMRNRKTKLFKAIHFIARKVEYVFLLTASPTVNEISDFWPLLCICDEKRFGSYWGFAFRFCEIMIETVGMKVGNTKEEEKDNLLKILDQYCLTRESDDDLPVPEWVIFPYVMSPIQKDLYNQMEKDDEAQLDGENCVAITSLAKITRLRQILLCPSLIFTNYFESSKIDAVISFVKEWKGQTLIFSQYAELASLVATRLDCRGIRSTYLSNKLDDATKNANLDAFHKGEYQAISMTYKMGGEGLNFISASQIIFMEYAWNPATMRHAYKRVLRRGQKNPNLRFVIIHADGTIDDDILAILKEKKKATIEEIMRRRG